ncbi:MAG TPA: hypothetical protein VJZ01_07670 [Lachnospiraceae bacterium]|nr:hypothetical protein [Lachnospiraceae bacterium]
MKKVSFRERLRYAFDNFMGKGTVALIGMLFLITAIVVVITGVLSCIGNSDASTGNQIWMSLMHALDAGTLAGDETSDIGFVILMTIVTICGIFVTSILIGIISSAFEEKLNSLRKGFSRVIEENHTVIIGFNDSIYTVMTELIEANSNHKNACILVIGQEEKEVMDEEIQNHIEDFKTTRVICRSGKPTNTALLEMASIETARSIIVNEEEDFAAIKAVLSVVAYMKQKNVFDNDTYITALIHNKENLEAARIAGEGKAEIIFFEDMITRVIANTCRQPGLSSVLTDMFDFGGSEFYFEEFPELTGKKFGDVLNMFDFSIVVGLCKGETPLLNPPMDTVIEAGDRMIHLAEDDGVSKPKAVASQVDIKAYMAERQTTEQEPFHMLILGYNKALKQLLAELEEFLTEDSRITIAGEAFPADEVSEWKNVKYQVSVMEKNIFELSGLQELIQEDTGNILLLADDECDSEEADEKILILLLQIRAILAKNNWKINITSEMNSVENQKLMQVANVNDFVVGSSITSLMIAQIAENRHLLSFFTTMLTSDGSELYMKPAKNYVKMNKKINFYELTEIVKQKNEILLGYKKMVNGQMQLTVGPVKTDKVMFTEEDYLIVIAED